ncbi:hypothetical protein KFK09_026392 [Dendrobium nobile]|uniref:Uncharacterized protein n=1 Tax=Dendrobium nobile TaxID=94219 RepID=A0A8T3A6P0_DENNO|nr:hypothetical protein KFK09_026392 [Dendrobium nobile]
MPLETKLQTPKKTEQNNSIIAHLNPSYIFITYKEQSQLLISLSWNQNMPMISPQSVAPSLKQLPQSAAPSFLKQLPQSAALSIILKEASQFQPWVPSISCPLLLPNSILCPSHRGPHRPDLLAGWNSRPPPVVN